MPEAFGQRLQQRRKESASGHPRPGREFLAGIGKLTSKPLPVMSQRSRLLVKLKFDSRRLNAPHQRPAEGVEDNKPVGCRRYAARYFG